MKTQDTVIEGRYPVSIIRPHTFCVWMFEASEKEELHGVLGTLRCFDNHRLWSVKISNAKLGDILAFQQRIHQEGGKVTVRFLDSPKDSPGHNVHKPQPTEEVNMTNSQLAQKVEALTGTVAQLAAIVGAQATATKPSKKASKKASKKGNPGAAKRKLAHQAGRVKQNGRQTEAGRAAYKKAYDKAAVANGLPAKYAARDAARAAA